MKIERLSEEKCLQNFGKPSDVRTDRRTDGTTDKAKCIYAADVRQRGGA